MSVVTPWLNRPHLLVQPCLHRQAQPRRRRSLVVCVKNDDAADSLDESRSFLSYLCPLLNVFSAVDLREPRPRWLEITTSGLASVARLPYGTNATSPSEETPSLPIRIYEFEGCPFCRRVREAVTDLDLIVDIYPCPKNAQVHRDLVQEFGGKLQFPFMVDENTGTQLYESGDIVKYLYGTYGSSRGIQAYVP